MKRVGYWRPLVRSRSDRPVSRDGRLYWPVRLVQEIEEHPLIADTQATADDIAQARDDLALPIPVADTLSPEDAELLAAWLDDGEVLAKWRGPSICRICGCTSGSRDLARDGYVYPEGLSHYVRDHLVAVPGLAAPEVE